MYFTEWILLKQPNNLNFSKTIKQTQIYIYIFIFLMYIRGFSRLDKHMYPKTEN